MDLTKFIQRRPYLYHLTDQRNLLSITNRKQLLSTVSIVELSQIENAKTFLSTKRPQHIEVEGEGEQFYIRDQKPINRALAKCLTHGWTPEDFIYHLNSHVFMWPTLSRLEKHYNRYKDEEPVILRFSTSELINLNFESTRFSRLNSGATRPIVKYGGTPPPRGPETFRTFEKYEDRYRSVAEVVFEKICNLPSKFELSYHPNGDWDTIDI